MSQTIKVKSARDAVHGILRTMTAEVPGDRTDINDGKKVISSGSHMTVSVNKKDYKYYPWGADNKTPSRLIALLRSNADMQNLLKTRADFLFGGGLMLYKYSNDGKDLILTPEISHNLQEWLLEKDVDGLADEYYTNIVELANGIINVDVDKDGEITLRGFDSSTVRRTISTEKYDYAFAVSAKWDTLGAKDAKVYKEYKAGDVKSGMDYLIHVKPKQPGQYYYGYAGWSALEPIIRLANKIPEFHTNAIDTEGNLGYIMHIAKKYFDDLKATYRKENGDEYTLDELMEAFDEEIDVFLLGGGKIKTLRDVCELNPATNELQKMMEVEAIKKANTGKEYIELAGYVLNAMTNGGQVLGGLAGMSDNKMNSGGGTEIRISAEYQQFYRTPRERAQFLRYLNMIYVPILKKKGLIGDNVWFGHQNILLQTLDKNKSGTEAVPGTSK